MQLRSGATIGRTAPAEIPPRTSPATPEEGIPDEIEINSPARQEQPNMATPRAKIPNTPVQAPQVYTAGTYVANLGRSPSEPENFRPSQFSFLPLTDYRTAREPSEPGSAGSICGKPSAMSLVPNQPAATSPQNQYEARDALRTLVFKAPMRPLDVAKTMYLD